MDGHTIKLEIITPDAELYSGDIQFLLVRATDGDIGILPGHAPLVAALTTWPMKIRDAEGNESISALFGGFMEVLPDKISIVTPNCELAEEIDVARAERAKERAESRLAHKDDVSIDFLRAEAALKRAVTRLDVVELTKQIKG